MLAEGFEKLSQQDVIFKVYVLTKDINNHTFNNIYNIYICDVIDNTNSPLNSQLN